MKHMVLVIALLAVACGTPTSPTGQSEGFDWTVNAQQFKASNNGRAASRGGSFTYLTGANCGSGGTGIVSIQLGAIAGPGTYSVSNDGVNVTWTPDASSGDAAGENWSAPGIPRVVGGVLVTGGSGTLTITSISNEWISGSFRFELVPSPTNRDTTTKTMLTTKFSATAVSNNACRIFPSRSSVMMGKASTTAHSTNSWLWAM